MSKGFETLLDALSRAETTSQTDDDARQIAIRDELVTAFRSTGTEFQKIRPETINETILDAMLLFSAMTIVQIFLSGPTEALDKYITVFALRLMQTTIDTNIAYRNLKGDPS